MKKQFLRAGIATIIMSTMLVGCGSSKYSASTENSFAASDGLYVNSKEDAGYSAYEEYDYEMAEDAMYDDVAEVEAPVEAEMLDDAASSRKLIRNVTLDVETEQFDELMSKIEAKTKSLGGYIENSHTYNGSSYYSSNLKSADLTIRIPSKKLDEFLSDVSEESNVTSKNESVTDVTLQYVDLESHKKALKAEQDRLLQMIEQAETVEDMITIESRLSDVRYQLESQEAQLRTFDNQIDYSTVYLTVSEVEKYTPVAERTIFQKIADGFSDNLVGVIGDFIDIIIWFITSLPYLVVWGAIIFAIVYNIRKSIINFIERKKRGIDKKTQKAEQKALKAQKKAEKKAKKNGQNATDKGNASEAKAEAVKADEEKASEEKTSEEEKSEE